jgi:hypothetical protein
VLDSPKNLILLHAGDEPRPHRIGKFQEHGAPRLGTRGDGSAVILPVHKREICGVELRDPPLHFRQLLLYQQACCTANNNRSATLLKPVRHDVKGRLTNKYGVEQQSESELRQGLVN